MTARAVVAGLTVALGVGVFAPSGAYAQISYQSGTVAGVVQTNDGQVPTNVRVVATSLTGEGQVETWLDGAGVYTLSVPVGDYQVTASLDYQLPLAAPVTVTVEPLQTVAADFLFAGATVHVGVVADGLSAEGPAARFRLHAPTCAEADTCWYVSDDGTECQCDLGGEPFYCDANGCEWMGGYDVGVQAGANGDIVQVLPEGGWDVIVLSSWEMNQGGHVPVAQLTVPVTDGGIVELGQVSYETGDVSGALTLNGAPLLDARVRAEKDGWSIDSYQVQGLYALKLPAATYTLVVDTNSSGEELARATVVVEAGGAQVVDFDLTSPGANVSGQITEDGGTVPATEVHLREHGPTDCSAADSCDWQSGSDECDCTVSGRRFWCTATDGCQWMEPRELRLLADDTGHFSGFVGAGTWDLDYYAATNRWWDPTIDNQNSWLTVGSVPGLVVEDGVDIDLGVFDYQTGLVGGALVSCGGPLNNVWVRATQPAGGQAEIYGVNDSYLMRLPVGDYTLSFMLDWRLELWSTPVTVTASAAIDLPYDANLGTLRGVIGRDGAPVGNAYAELHRSPPASCAVADVCYWDDGVGSCSCELDGDGFDCNVDQGCFWHDGQVAAAETHADGTFELSAPAGDYVVRAYSDEVPGQNGRIFVGSVDADLSACALTEIGASVGQVFVGQNVFVDLGEGVTVSFGEVTEGGAASFLATTNPQGGPAPDAIRFLGLYYDIVVDPTYSPPITVCIDYDPADVLPGQAEHLTLFHRAPTGWEDATVSVDTQNHVVCGVVSSLSWFVVGLPTELPPIAPIPFAGDSQSILLDGGACTADVTLDGSGSIDANSTWPSTNDDIVSYVWSEGGVELAQGQIATVSLPAGVHEIMLTVVDSDGLSAEELLVVEIIDPQQPTLSCDMISVCPESGDRNTVCHKGKTLHLGNGKAAVAHLGHGDTAGPCGGDHQVADGRALVCHDGRTLEVAADAVPAHISHGDYVGPCGAGCEETQQLLRASWTLGESCDASWAATGRVNGIGVSEGQVVDWSQTLEGSSGAIVGGVLDIDAPKLALLVQAANDAGEVVECRWYPDTVVTECTEAEQGAIDTCLETCVAPPPPPECAVCDELNAQILDQCLVMGTAVDACDTLHGALGGACTELFCTAPSLDCAESCAVLGDQARAVCQLEPWSFEPVSCDEGGQLVTELCQAQVCGTQPSCEDACMQQADAEREECLSAGEAPDDCEWRWQDSYETCVQSQCQAPVPCEQTCFDELQDETMACILGPEDSPECTTVRSCLDQCGGCPSVCQLDAARAYAPCLEQGVDPGECQDAVQLAYEQCVQGCGTGACWPECVSGDGWCPASCSPACDADCTAFDPCDPDLCSPDDQACLDTRCDGECDPDCAFDACDPELCSPDDDVCMDPRCDPSCDPDCGPTPCDPDLCALDGACDPSCPVGCDVDCEPYDPCDPVRCVTGDGICGAACDETCDQDCGPLYCDPAVCHDGDGVCYDGCDATCDPDCAGPVDCDTSICVPGDGQCEPSCGPECDPDCATAWCDPTVCDPNDGICDRAMCDETCDDDCMIAWCDPAVCAPGDGICDRAWCDESCDDDCAMYCSPDVCLPGDGICERSLCDESCDDDCAMYCSPDVCLPGDGICERSMCDESCDDDCAMYCSPDVCLPGDGICDRSLCDEGCDPDCEVQYCDPNVCLPGDGICERSMCDEACDPDCGPTGTCESQCQQTVDPVRQQCYALLADPAGCDQLSDFAVQACVDLVCAGGEPPCDGGCGTFANMTRDACEPLFDPAMCDLGFSALTDSCVAVFGCGTTPSCEQQCEVSAEEARMDCEQQGLDPMDCEQLWQSVLEDCLTACNPPPVGCEDQCQAEGEALFQQCVTPDDIDL